MAASAIVTTGYGLAKTLGISLDDITGIVTGGGREDGYGLTKPGTLAWYIDKLKGVNDNEAVQMAVDLLSMKQSGASQQRILSYLKQNSSEGVLGPEEYQPILDSLEETKSIITNEAQRQNSQLGNVAPGGSVKAGFSSSLMLLLLLAGGGFFIAKSAK